MTIGMLINGRQREDLLAKRLKEVAAKREREAEEALQRNKTEPAQNAQSKKQSRRQSGENPDSSTRSSRQSAGAQSSSNPFIKTGPIAKTPDGHFLFFDVPYQHRVLPCIERPMEPLDGWKIKGLDSHLKWLSNPKNGMADYTIADMELEFQLARISFELRGDRTVGALADEYIRGIQNWYLSPIITADQIQYGTNWDAVITNRGQIPSQRKIVTIPTYRNGQMVLSKARWQSEVDKVTTINDPVQLVFLREYLGFGYERAGAVLSYCSPRCGVKLRKTVIWTPSLKNRSGIYPSGLGVLSLQDEMILFTTKFSSAKALAVGLRDYISVGMAGVVRSGL